MRQGCRCSVYLFYLYAKYIGKLDWKKVSVVLNLEEEPSITCTRLIVENANELSPSNESQEAQRKKYDYDQAERRPN